MNVLTDPIAMRALERLLIAFGAIIFALLGYKLFMFGVREGRGNLEAESKFFKIVFSGSGPGLFFMAFGALILVTALFTGGGSRETKDGWEKAVVQEQLLGQEQVLAITKAAGVNLKTMSREQAQAAADKLGIVVPAGIDAREQISQTLGSSTITAAEATRILNALQDAKAKQ